MHISASFVPFLATFSTLTLNIRKPTSPGPLNKPTSFSHLSAPKLLLNGGSYSLGLTPQPPPSPSTVYSDFEHDALLPSPLYVSLNFTQTRVLKQQTAKLHNPILKIRRKLKADLPL
ncbi:hypothetical protein L596_000361 [Steinernema carpocapsae]|uniref:Uncharacterized protein n=1 Tax=Steinernema carpocapsae TaxID=34508 RepID=A0A4V6I6X5_STECR|nr:hypothetical protein L596_000361 [Steinernema carpocapsae]